MACHLHEYRFLYVLQKTLAPRGTETAQTLYNINEGWVTHDEMNASTSLLAVRFIQRVHNDVRSSDTLE